MESSSIVKKIADVVIIKVVYIPTHRKQENCMEPPLVYI